MSAIDELLANRADHARDFSQGGLPAPPARRVAIVACMDARLDPGRLLGLEAGDAHVIRNAGGAVTEDVVRSLAVSQRLLGTREVMLIHHTDCGMAKVDEEEVLAEIERDVGVRPPFALEAIADLEQGLRDAIARIHASPFIPHKQAVRGFVYEVESGRLRELA